MKRMFFIIFCFCLVSLLIIPNYSFAEDRKLNIEIIDHSNDSIGRVLVYKVTEKIRENPSFKLIYSDETRVSIEINTMDWNNANPNQLTIYGIVWCLKEPNQPPKYIESTIGYCRLDKTDDAADLIVAETGRIDSTFRKICKVN